MTGRARRWTLGLLLACGLLGACGRGGAPQPIPPVGEAAQRTLLPADPYEDARRALLQRQLRRERLFREAYEPGSLWAPLRVEQGDIDAGRVGLPRLLDIGRDLFALDHGPAQGLGNGLAGRTSPLAGARPAPNLRHVHYRGFGGPDATRCLSCHHVGGDAGGGFRSDNTFLDGDGKAPGAALERNPRALLGIALLQRLGEEMTAELQEQRRRAARGSDTPLVAKGVSFGRLKLDRRGRLDRRALSGVDPDLVVRPLGWKGTVATVREAVERALQQNLGLQSDGWLRAHRGQPELIGDGPDPADPDADGVRREYTDGMVTALVAYLSALAPPIEAPPEVQRFALYASQGAEQFQRLGCAGCHVPELPLQRTVVSLGPGRGGPVVDLAPLLRVAGRAERLPGVRLFSDLRRHDLGEGLADRRADPGVDPAARRQWLTPPLWGVSASGPYLHDGRASTIEAAILSHGGEAQAARDAYNKLSMVEQGWLHLYLSGLDRPHHLEFRK